VIATVYDVYSSSLVLDAKTREDRRKLALSKAFHLLVHSEQYHDHNHAPSSHQAAASAKTPILQSKGAHPRTSSAPRSVIVSEIAHQKFVLKTSTCVSLLAKLRPHYPEAKLEVF
jgi:hypothetical protein